jgi:hypothetical protein
VTLEHFHSWADVLAYARRGAPLYYHAPLDSHPVRIYPKTWDGEQLAYVVRARTIRIWPSGSTGRGRRRTSDPFTADAGHLDRFRYPARGVVRENPTLGDHVDNAVGHFVNEHPWISALVGGVALGAAGYVGVLITQAVVRSTPSSSTITSGSSDTSKGPTSTSTSTTSTNSTPSYDASNAVSLFIQNAGKEVTVGTSLTLLDASTGLPVNGAVEGSAGVLEAGPTVGTFLAVAPGTVKIYAPDGQSTTVVVKAASGAAGVALSPRRPMPKLRGLASLLLGTSLANGA